MALKRDRPRICHITTVHPVFDTRIFHRECKSLAQEGYEVFLIAQNEESETIDGVHIIALPFSRSKILRRLVWPWLAMWHAFKLRADLYHFHDPELFPIMQILRLLRRVPLIWDAHEYYPPVIHFFNQLGWQPLSDLGARLFEIYELWAVKKSCAGVVTITERMAKRYRSRGALTAVVGNQVEVEELKSNLAAAPRAEPPIILISGMLIEDHGIFEILETFQKIESKHPCRLSFCGRFFDKNTEVEFHKVVAQMKMGDKIKFEGPVPRRKFLDEKLPASSIGCILFLNLEDVNSRMGLPNRLAEYWAKEMAVIVSKDTNLADLVAECQGGLITDNSTTDLYRCLEILLSDPQKRRQMGQSGKRLVESKLNWSTAYANLSELYKDVGLTRTF